MSDSFFDVELSWAVDQAGMQLLGLEPTRSGLFSPDSFIVGKGGPLRRTTPAKITSLLPSFLKVETTEQLLKFCTLYGPLTHRGFTGPSQKHLRGYVDLSKGDDLAECLGHADWFRKLLRKSPSAVAEEVSKHSGEFLKTTVRASKRSGLRFVLAPDDLLGLLRVRLFELLNRGDALAFCEHCGDLFQRGPGSKRRRDAIFCSKQHKISHHSQARSFK